MSYEASSILYAKKRTDDNEKAVFIKVCQILGVFLKDDACVV